MATGLADRTLTASIGSDLRALRKARGLTLSALAETVGRSVGWLSEVERDLTEPSLADLQRLADTLEQPLSLFFAAGAGPAEEEGYVVRDRARRRLGSAGQGLTEELLSPDLSGSFEIIRTIFAPGAELAQAKCRATEDAGYLVSGLLDLWIGERQFRLEPGDSFRFHGEPYRWRNPGEEPAVCVWVIAPPVY